MKIAVSLVALDRLLGADIARIGELARMAEDKGLDQLCAAEHVIMSENVEAYPYGKYTLPVEEPWYDPFLLLAAAAAATDTIGLGSGIIISPLRPAVVLAKEIATLDRLSRGRVALSLGVGWQKEEYDAAGVPWEGRFGYLMEQIAVCRKLWTEAPASFSGKFTSFERLYSLPFPVQGGNVPLWLGLAPTERNIERIAQSADGWTPIERDPEKLVEPIGLIHARLKALGRDPASFSIRLHVSPPIENGIINWNDLREHALRARQIGVTMMLFTAGLYCSDFRQLAEMFDGLAALKADLISASR